MTHRASQYLLRNTFIAMPPYAPFAMPLHFTTNGCFRITLLSTTKILFNKPLDPSTEAMPPLNCMDIHADMRHIFHIKLVYLLNISCEDRSTE